MARVNISRNPEKLLLLAEEVIKKHEADANQSPLKMLNMADLKAKTIEARTKYEKALQMRKDAKAYTQDVQQLLGIDKRQTGITDGTILFYVNQCRNVLSGIYRSAMKVLGGWGFEVFETKRKPKATKKIIQKTG